MWKCSLSVGGRFIARWPLLIIAVWIIVVLAALRFGPSLSSVSAKQNTSSLPASAPSMRTDQVYTTKFAAGQQSLKKVTDLLVLTDPQGISAQDVALAEHIEAWLQAPATRPAQLLSVTGPGAQVSASFFESGDHQALRLILTWDRSKGNVPESSIKAIDDFLVKQAVPQGGTLGLTGSAPINYDLSTSIFNTHGLRNEMHIAGNASPSPRWRSRLFLARNQHHLCLMKAGEPRRMFSSHLISGLHLVAEVVGFAPFPS